MLPHPTDTLRPYQDPETAGPYDVQGPSYETIITGTYRECRTWIESHTGFSLWFVQSLGTYRIVPSRVGP